MRVSDAELKALQYAIDILQDQFEGGSELDDTVTHMEQLKALKAKIKASMTPKLARKKTG